MTYTILRPTYFMDVWLSPALGFDLAGGKVTVYGAGQNKVSWIALGDVAQFAVEAVDNPGARNATVPLGGPQPLSYKEVIALAERLGGRPIAVEYVPEAVLEAQRVAATSSHRPRRAGRTRSSAGSRLRRRSARRWRSRRSARRACARHRRNGAAAHGRQPHPPRTAGRGCRTRRWHPVPVLAACPCACPRAPAARAAADTAE